MTFERMTDPSQASLQWIVCHLGVFVTDKEVGEDERVIKPVVDE